jgi:protein O-mannosyl-transferase
MSSAEPSASVKTDTRTAVACGVLVLLAGLAYVNSLDNPFVYDDYRTVVDNPSIRSLVNVRNVLLHDLSRPLTSASYALDYAGWGGRAFGYRLTNVVLHALNVTLLFVLMRQLSGDRADRSDLVGGGPATKNPALAAFVAAALLAVHPMMTESVAYISGRSDVLCATFFLLAMMAGRRWLRDGGPTKCVMMLTAWALAMASKETGAMFPFVLAAYDRLALDRSDWHRRFLRIHLPLIGIALLLGFARLGVLVAFESPGQARIHWSYLWLALDVARRYTTLLLAPLGQSIFHAVDNVTMWSAPTAVAIVVLGLIVALAWLSRRSAWMCSFGLVWFLLLLLPGAVLTVLNQGEPMAEHRVYLASCGLFLAIGDAVGRSSAWFERLGLRPWVPRVAIGLVLVSCLGLTVTRNQVWSSPVSLWGEAVDLAPEHFRPRLLLGEALEDSGRRSEAADEYRTAIRLQPSDPTGHIKLGQLLARTGQIQAAREQFQLVLAADPQNEHAHQSLAMLDRLPSRSGKGPQP